MSTTSESSASEDESTGKKNALKNGHVDKKSKSTIVDATKSSSSMATATTTIGNTTTTNNNNNLNSNNNNNNSNNNNNRTKDTKKLDKPKFKDRLSKDDGAGSDSGKETKKTIKTTTVKDMLRAKRDSMRNMIDSGGVKSTTEHSDDSENESSSSDDSSESSDDERTTVTGDGTTTGGNVNGQSRQSDVRLPDNIPNDLMAYINKITEVAKNGHTSKHNFFDTNTMELLYK